MNFRLKALDRNQSGVTLVELLVVIAIIAVIATFALLQQGSANTQLKRQNAARELKAAFERARFDSVKRRACDTDHEAKVVVNDSSFDLWTDKDMDGTPESSEIESTSFDGQNIQFAGIGLNVPVTVSFNQRGEVSATDGASTVIDPGFLVCNGQCSDTPSNSDTNKVYVTPTGTVNLLGGSESPPTFGPPGGSTVGSGEEINDNMLLSESTGCS